MKRKVPDQVPLAFEEVDTLFTASQFYGLSVLPKQTKGS